MKDYFKYKSVWITLVAVLAIMTAIFCLSAQTREESTETSGYIVDVFINLFYPDFYDMSAIEQENALSEITNTIRKLAHFAEYTVLGFFLTLHIRELKNKLKLRINIAWAALIGIMYAISDEIHQYFVPGRGPGVKDVLIDSCGVIVGFALMLTVAVIICRKKAD